MAAHIKSAQATPIEDAALWSMSQQSMDEIAKAYSTWLERAAKLSNEAFRFAHYRVTKDLEAAAQLMRCNDPNEALTLQAEFANKLAADYVAESQKMAELVSQLTTEGHMKPRHTTGGRRHAH